MLALRRPNDAGRLWAPDQLLLAVFDAIPNAVGVIDRGGRLVHANTAWKELAARTGTYGGLGTLVSPDDHEGSAYLGRMSRLDGPLAMPAHRLARAIQDVLDGHDAGPRITYRMKRPEGELPFEVAVRPLPSDNGPLAIVQHLDGVDRERVEQLRDRAAGLSLVLEEERAQSRRLRRRLAALGQDLHTPITPVALELHLLGSESVGPLNERQRKALDVVGRNVRRWIDSEQHFMRLPDDAWSPAGPFDLAHLAARVVEERQTQALQQGVRLVHLKGSELRVQASEELVQDVLHIFLTHALAATSVEGTVAIEARQQDGEIVVEVADSGPGLGPRELRELFEPAIGPGAGGDSSLAYARHAITASGGRVFASSEGQGQGLRLGIAFPAAHG